MKKLKFADRSSPDNTRIIGMRQGYPNNFDLIMHSFTSLGVGEIHYVKMKEWELTVYHIYSNIDQAISALVVGTYTESSYLGETLRNAYLVGYTRQFTDQDNFSRDVGFVLSTLGRSNSCLLDEND